MLDAEKLKQDLLAAGKVSAARMASAETYAREHGVSLAEALVRLLMISFPDLGAACARLTGLPYAPLMDLRPSPESLRWMSVDFAAHAGAFPVNYDPEAHRLTMAIWDPEQAQTLERMLRFLDHEVNLTFTIASAAEIERAVARTRTPHGGVGRALPRPVRAAQGPAKAEKRPTPAGSGSAPAPRSDPPAAREPSYADMSQALVSASMLLARQCLADKPEEMHLARTRVRYCQLLASRLRLTAVQTDALTVASWLSMLPEDEGLASKLTTPYRLEDVLTADRRRGSTVGDIRIEALVLSLVRAYQHLKDEQPDARRDITLARRELFRRWTPPRKHVDMLETFLQILVDEEFLDNLGQSGGRILIVDPEEVSLCALAPPLISMGYDVVAMPDTRSAREAMEEFRPDLILVSMDGTPDRALWFCERVKGDARTAGTPILAVVGGDNAQLAVRCLRAGANDFLAKPVNTELLFLKVQNHLSAVGVSVRECGVSGSLDEMSFTDMIQILCAGRRSVDLFLNMENEEGRVYIRDGEIVHAMLGALRGEPAFYALMRGKSGTFTTRQCGETPERSIQSSSMSLLMEGARMADEHGATDGAAATPPSVSSLSDVRPSAT